MKRKGSYVGSDPNLKEGVFTDKEQHSGKRGSRQHVKMGSTSKLAKVIYLRGVLEEGSKSMKEKLANWGENLNAELR